MQMGEVWLITIECFIRSGSLKQSGGHLIAHMDKRGHSFASEGGRQARLIEHGNDAFFNCSVGPLHHTILLRPVSDGVLSLDAMINAEHLKLPRHVFPTLVVM